MNIKILMLSLTLAIASTLGVASAQGRQTSNTALRTETGSGQTDGLRFTVTNTTPEAYRSELVRIAVTIQDDLNKLQGEQGEFIANILDQEFVNRMVAKAVDELQGIRAVYDSMDSANQPRGPDPLIILAEASWIPHWLKPWDYWDGWTDHIFLCTNSEGGTSTIRGAQACGNCAGLATCIACVKSFSPGASQDKIDSICAAFP